VSTACHGICRPVHGCVIVNSAGQIHSHTVQAGMHGGQHGLHQCPGVGQMHRQRPLSGTQQHSSDCSQGVAFHTSGGGVSRIRSCDCSQGVVFHESGAVNAAKGWYFRSCECSQGVVFHESGAVNAARGWCFTDQVLWLLRSWRGLTYTVGG
jgi:hypothetical protein